MNIFSSRPFTVFLSLALSSSPATSFCFILMVSHLYTFLERHLKVGALGKRAKTVCILQPVYNASDVSRRKIFCLRTAFIALIGSSKAYFKFTFYPLQSYIILYESFCVPALSKILLYKQNVFLLLKTSSTFYFNPDYHCFDGGFNWLSIQALRVR
jgi:hypothetical protein